MLFVQFLVIITTQDIPFTESSDITFQEIVVNVLKIYFTFRLN